LYLAVIMDLHSRRVIGWQTPAEALDRLLKQDVNEDVATTG